MAVGVDGLFLEVHDQPQSALSDAATQFPLDALQPLLGRLLRIRAAALEPQARAQGAEHEA
jgi:2-dehydro-3-deoxyphosphooctonate aldolase (KDO 8-P synthase)